MKTKYKFGLMNKSITRLRSGPMVFMDRLSEGFSENGMLDQSNFDLWVNLSFRSVPKFVGPDIPVVVRFDGMWAQDFFPNYENNLMSSIGSLVNKYTRKILNRKLVENYKKSTAIVYQSEFSKRIITKYISDRNEKLNIVIPNGVNLDQFKPSVNKKKSNFIKIVVSHKFWPHKRFDQIPLIALALKKRGIKFHINVLGDGLKNPLFLFEDTINHFKKIVTTLNLQDKFTFHGHISPAELPRFYKLNDLMLNLSYADPCPNVVIESMACGLPIVAPNHGGIAELVKNDLLINEKIDELQIFPLWNYDQFPRIDPDKYASKIILAFENKVFYSDQMRQRALENYNLDLTIQKYIAFLSSVVEKKY